jgi:DNA excision repair protein ERCC-2
MNEAERDAFLARFSTSNRETLVGLAVMGGVFGEGIDLVGERLIGAVVVGVGVPQVCLERDLIKDYFDRQNGNGFAYAYQYPGFNRVLQATGRVIRTEVDRGIIILIDERFTHARYRQLFPNHWRGFQIVQNTSGIADKLALFWSRE